MKYYRSTVLKFLILCVIAGCQPEQRSVKEPVDFEEFKEAPHDVLAEQLQHVLLELPKPGEIPAILENMGATFDEGLVNDLTHTEGYLNLNEKAALNLGVYSADIAYLAVYNQIQESLRYLEHAQSLANEINVSSAFDLIMKERFKENLGDRKKLALIIDEFIHEASEILRTSYRTNTAVLVVAGSYIEGLYLSAGIFGRFLYNPNFDESDNKILEELIEMILEQKDNIYALNELLSSVEQNQHVEDLQGNFDELAKAFERFESKEQQSEMNLKGLFEDADFINIVTQIMDMRQNITSG